MAFLSELGSRVDRLAATYSLLDVPSEMLPAAVDMLGDTDALDVLAAACAIARQVDLLRVAAAGVAGRRSTPERGQSGLATSRGHRTPVDLIQSITGGTRAEARRDVDVGSALLDPPTPEPGPGDADDGSADGAAHPTPAPWHDILRVAMLDSVISAAQHDAIRRGLGEPPVREAEDEAAAAQVWRIAATQLIAEASSAPVEELTRRARQVRDTLDEAGAEERFAHRFASRSFRMWVDADGTHRARITFDDEMAAWIRGILDAALRPRRGGLRFISDAERAAAAAMVDDDRTNEQLSYDLLTDVLRAGALATATDVFGARQPGVRLIVVKDLIGPRDAFGRLLAVGYVEDGGDALPGSVIERALCSSGQREVTVDACGNPLDVGREQRLFTAKQKLALAIRDGGCLWPGCASPPSYCEAHHCDHWWADAGRTDLDRGVLLCRFHHLLLHNQRFRITRRGTGPFMLESPPGGREAIPLRSRSAVRWAWDPPPLDRPGWREQARRAPRVA